MFDFVKNEHEILKFWNDHDVFHAMREKVKNSAETYRTLDGPITANAPMGVHHAWGRTLKDALIKYNVMRGRKTHFQNGFDAQGMWVEVEVEKHLGLRDKKAIAEYGLAQFTEKCIERVNHFAKVQTEQSIRLGQIMDWGNSYFTNSDHNIECIWNFLKVCHERGMLTRSHKAMAWCPRCGTSLSEHEMHGSYRELKHNAVFIKAKFTKFADNKLPAYLLVWTTTPWTLSSNVAVAVNPKHKYLSVEVDGEILVVGKEALRVIKKHGTIVKEFYGSDLVDMTYEPFLDLGIQRFEHKIVPWDAVEATEGTGAVHIAPGCGAEDFELGKKLGLRNIIPTDDAGVFTHEFGFLSGMTTTNCEDAVFNKLRENGKLFYTHEHAHNYPFCWRCKTNVIFKLVEGWDIATEKIKPDLLKAARGVKWDPTFALKTMEDWLTNMGDWNISRRRFYGLPLPIYPCKCGHVHVIGSRAELKKMAYIDVVDELPHLHRPYIDQIEIRCPHCGSPIKRIPDVGDCWLDAGIAPFSTAAKDYMPSSVVIEMKEQVRLWFYAQLFMSVVLANRAPYEKVIGYGMVVDENGGKFSKSGANNFALDVACDKFSADAIRYLYTSNNPTSDVRFGANLIEETKRKMLGLMNPFVFFNTYYNIDRPDIAGYTPTIEKFDPIDQWLFQVSQKYVADCTAFYENHKLHEVINATEKLVEELSNLYIRVNRRRFWKNENSIDKINAYYNLYHTLKNITRVIAPIIPFTAEHLWQTVIKVVEPDSSPFVLTANFPTEPTVTKNADYLKNGGDQIANVDFVRGVISAALSLRSRENLRLRQPLSTLYVRTKNNDAITAFANIIKDEVNVHTVAIVTDDTQFNVPYLSVNFKTAGAILKGDVQRLKYALVSLGEKDMAKATEEYKSGHVAIKGFDKLPANAFVLMYKTRPEFVSLVDGELTIVLDTTLNAQLVEEGILREMVRAIQVARQTANLEITARIALSIASADEAINAVVAKYKNKICDEVLAVDYRDKIHDAIITPADIDGKQIEIKFKVVANEN